MLKKIVGALAAFLGLTLLVQVVAMGATSVDPLFVCVRVNFDWRAPYADGSCPTYYVKVEIQKAGGGGGGGGGTAASPQYLSSTVDGTVSTFFGSPDIQAALPLSGFIQQAAPRGSDETTVPGFAQTLATNTTLTTISLTFVMNQAASFGSGVVSPRATLHAAPAGSAIGVPTPLSCDGVPAFTGFVPLGTIATCTATGFQVPLTAGQRAWVQISTNSTGMPVAAQFPFSGSVGIS